MGKSKQIGKNIILIMISILLMIGICMPVKAEWSLTPEEKAYIAESTVIQAVSVDKAAPLQYSDADGAAQGISVRVVEKIADMTGLVFEYKLYDSLDEALNSNADIYFGMPTNYAPADMVLSQPFLESETILFINSSLNLERLDDKIYAAVKGSALPEGIGEENTIYFDTREESLNAVEAGQADYGYGNAYSVAFYTLQNGYKNIITIPKEKESREYGIGLLKDNDLLFSIITKSISEINESQMQSIILDATMRIERKITFSMIMDAHGKKIFAAISASISILLFCVISNIRTNNKLKMQNKRYEKLAQISNEYLYEYFVKHDWLELSDKCIQLFGNQEKLDGVSNILKQALCNHTWDDNTFNINLPIINGEIGIFKAVNSNIYNDKGKLESIIGKLIDISEEIAEKEELIMKSQVDGLTGLYNAVTTKEHIIKNINTNDQDKVDAMILMDCDEFKEINDTFGHLVGDQILEHIAKNLELIFRNADIIGRMGGDEFCIYIKDITSIDFIEVKYQQLSNLINEGIGDVNVSVSMGVALLDKKKTYEDLFKQADDALYQAKNNGRAQVVISSVSLC